MRGGQLGGPDKGCASSNPLGNKGSKACLYCTLIEAMSSDSRLAKGERVCHEKRTDCTTVDDKAMRSPAGMRNTVINNNLAIWVEMEADSCNAATLPW